MSYKDQPEDTNYSAIQYIGHEIAAFGQFLKDDFDNIVYHVCNFVANTHDECGKLTDDMDQMIIEMDTSYLNY